MKRIIFGFVIVLFVLTSCDKSEDIVYEKTSMDTQSSTIKTEVEKKYRSFTCTTDAGLKGTKCAISAWSSSTCKKATDCKASDDNILSQSFTEQELADWSEGTYEFEYTESYIRDHYDYFLYLYENELSFHPDTVIMIINND